MLWFESHGYPSIWRAIALQPHRTETFKLHGSTVYRESSDIVGLYLNPPDRALVLCVDEKAEIQALERTRPLLPMRPGPLIVTCGMGPLPCLPPWMRCPILSANFWDSTLAQSFSSLCEQIQILAQRPPGRLA
jgi:hypothetical protein